MICQISSSVIPTPWPLVPLAGIAVPGIPLLMFWNKSASELPWRFCACVRSGPRPPPRAPSPWQKAQLMRNSNSPALAALASLASGFLSCARTLGTTAAISTRTAPSETLAQALGEQREKSNLIRFLLAGAHIKFGSHYTTEREPSVLSASSIFQHTLRRPDCAHGGAKP